MKLLKIELLLGLMAFGFLLSSCTWDSADNPVPSSTTTIWTGPKISFSKNSGADPSLAENQDRISDRVWITRGNEGGQIYNAVSEASAEKTTSPAGTLWAVGTTADLQTLEFDNFRIAVEKPQNVVGKDLVLFLVGDNIAIDIKFTAWANNNMGGFAYERSSN
ncbi:MAG: hypothetical protein AAFQ87_12095 [Bacteroidota bacterium]